MTQSTLKFDVLAALKKERGRLNAIEAPCQMDEDRLSLCVEFIKRINGAEVTEMEITVPWQGPLRL